MNELVLPSRIKKHLNGMRFEQNEVGCSHAKVYRFFSDTYVLYLKIDSKSGELEAEYKNLLWMNGKLPVPRIIEWVSEEDNDYLLISDIGGKMICDEYYIQNPILAVSLLADGINLLRSTDIKDCPMNNNLDRKLMIAEENVKLNLIDMSDWEPSSERFSTPWELLIHLMNNRPKDEELVFTHGDYCLPNIFGEDNRLSGFIDLGRAGIADLWQDVALCIRSLRYNYKTTEYDELLLKQIGIPLNQEKLDYYILLDELF